MIAQADSEVGERPTTLQVAGESLLIFLWPSSTLQPRCVALGRVQGRQVHVSLFSCLRGYTSQRQDKSSSTISKVTRAWHQDKHVSRSSAVSKVRSCFLRALCLLVSTLKFLHLLKHMSVALQLSPSQRLPPVSSIYSCVFIYQITGCDRAGLTFVCSMGAYGDQNVHIAG